MPGTSMIRKSARSHSGNLIRKPGISTIRSRWNASMKIVKVQSRTAALKRITGKKIYPLTAVIRAGRSSIMTASISPEEPKTVVTASGKIIETDTEMVPQNHREKESREKKSQAGGDELSLNEQIEKRAEAAKVVKERNIVPPLNLLKKGAKNSGRLPRKKEYKETAIAAADTAEFWWALPVTNISCGPSVTRYELHPEQGVKVGMIVALSDDIS